MELWGKKIKKIGEVNLYITNTKKETEIEISRA